MSPIQGAMWCPVHHGIADECNNRPVCDMFYELDGPCDLRDMFYADADIGSRCSDNAPAREAAS